MPLKRLPLIAASVFLGLSACSATSYQASVQAFATGVNAIGTSAQADVADTAALELAQRDAGYSQQRGSVKLTLSCYTMASSPPCDIGPGSGGEPPPAYPHSPQEQAADALGQKNLAALQQYAAALVAIESASTKVDLTAASQSVSGLLTQMKDKQAAAVATPSASLLGSLFGFYLEEQRYRALRDAVLAVGTPTPGSVLEMLAQPIGVMLGNYQREERTAYLTAADVASRPLGSQARTLTAVQYAAELKLLEADLLPLQQSLKTDAQSVVDAMLKAHAALVTAVASDTGQTTQLLDAIGQFATAAAKLEAAAAAEPDAGTKPAASGKPAAK